MGSKLAVFLALILSLALLVGGCTSASTLSEPAAFSPTPSLPPSGTAEVINTTISVDEANNLIQSNQDNPDFIILDVRTPEEFSGGHIAGAVNLDVSSPDFQEQLDNLDKDKKYLVYCRTARRSAEAARIMKTGSFHL
jgi:rhodanese-related sulfurtransferase